MSPPLLSTHVPFSAVVEQFQSGSTTPREFLELCLEAVERSESTVQALVYTDFDNARKLADESTTRYRSGRPLSPIDGMPVGIKDIIDIAGMPTQMNNALYKNYRPKGDAAAVRAIYEGGGIPVGKTVTTEFAIGRSGPTVNPHNPLHTPGGSSSGSAAGTAAGMFPAALGTQTQGSIIRPASFCGVVGYKPTRARLSTDGIHPLSTSHDHLGVLSDTVDDAWWLARWISERAAPQNCPGLSGPLRGPVPSSPLTRVAVLRTQGYDDLDSPSLAAFEQKLEQLRSSGVAVVESQSEPLLEKLVSRLDRIPSISLDMVAYEMRWPYMGYLATQPESMGPRIHALMEQAQGLTRHRYQEILLYRDELARYVAALQDEYDAFILPAAGGPAPEGFEYTGARTLLVYSSFLGIPAFSLPVMKSGAMPFGLQLLGFADGDYRLTRHAQWLMQQFANAK
ncbi:amidase [Allopusillimonas ginsengisoli]|uniref:amidase n=1 Tax=Allopusillimonas ginsengisoli TaxID=453575 RepID=UPI0010C1DA5A|nr:amidase [Allopusillimonas ginsengisoli]